MIQPSINTKFELAIPAMLAGIFAGFSALFLANLPTVEKQNSLIAELVPTEAILSFVQGQQQASVSAFIVAMLLAAILIYRWARVQRRVQNYTRVILALIFGLFISLGCLFGLQQIMTLQPVFQLLVGACLVGSWMVICVYTFPWTMPLQIWVSGMVIFTQFLSAYRGI